jgi:hypothetical protein
MILAKKSFFLQFVQTIWPIFKYFFQHCFFRFYCVGEETGIEPRTSAVYSTAHGSTITLLFVDGCSNLKEYTRKLFNYLQVFRASVGSREAGGVWLLTLI